MGQKNIATLSATDWNEEWKLLQQQRRIPDNSEFWDERAKTFGVKDAPSPYVDRFLKLADIHEGETVFDMGCGNGALSVPLGEAGFKVFAADFSTGMLDSLKETLERHHVTSVTPLQMSWDDNWEEFGIHENMVDVAVASRSMATDDLRDSLLKLTSVAKRRVCVTVSTSASPRINDDVLRAVGVTPRDVKDYQYLLNILINEGFHPSLNYIDSAKPETFDSVEQAFEKYAKMIREGAACQSDEEVDAGIERLRVWIQTQLSPNPTAGEDDGHAGHQGKLVMTTPRSVSWAFISWDK